MGGRQIIKIDKRKKRRTTRREPPRRRTKRQRTKRQRTKRREPRRRTTRRRTTRRRTTRRKNRNNGGGNTLNRLRRFFPSNSKNITIPTKHTRSTPDVSPSAPRQEEFHGRWINQLQDHLPPIAEETGANVNELWSIAGQESRLAPLRSAELSRLLDTIKSKINERKSERKQREEELSLRFKKQLEEQLKLEEQERIEKQKLEEQERIKQQKEKEKKRIEKQKEQEKKRLDEEKEKLDEQRKGETNKKKLLNKELRKIKKTEEELQKKIDEYTFYLREEVGLNGGEPKKWYSELKTYVEDADEYMETNKNTEYVSRGYLIYGVDGWRNNYQATHIQKFHPNLDKDLQNIYVTIRLPVRDDVIDGYWGEYQLHPDGREIHIDTWTARKKKNYSDKETITQVLPPVGDHEEEGVVKCPNLRRITIDQMKKHSQRTIEEMYKEGYGETTPTYIPVRYNDDWRNFEEYDRSMNSDWTLDCFRQRYRELFTKQTEIILEKLSEDKSNIQQKGPSRIRKEREGINMNQRPWRKGGQKNKQDNTPNEFRGKWEEFQKTFYNLTHVLEMKDSLILGGNDIYTELESIRGNIKGIDTQLNEIKSYNEPLKCKGTEIEGICQGGIHHHPTCPLYNHPPRF